MPAFRLRLIPVVCAVAASAIVLAAPPAGAQLPDPYLTPRGVLRVSFTPSYTNYDLLFDSTGTAFPLGTFFSSDSLGVAFFPTLAPAQAAVRSITGDPTYRLNAGIFTAMQDADIRRFPFNFEVGVTSRLALTATIPIVTTRVHSVTSLDSTGANAGWNQVASLAENDSALQNVTTLLMELETAATMLEADVAAGTFNCPSAMCDLADEVIRRARQLASDLSALSGVSADGTTGLLPPFAPLAASAEGMAIATQLGALATDLQTLGQAGLSGTMPLPTTPVGDGAVNQILAGDVFGYSARTLDPEDPAKLSRIGDVELGFRYALGRGPRVRLILGALARLPTGFRDLNNDYLDIGPGDRQLDFTWSLDGALEPGNRLGVWFGASYTLQLGDRLVRRITRPDAPIALASSETTVERNLGEIVTASIHPLLRLNDVLRVFVSASFRRKGADQFTLNGTRVPELEAFTAQRTWSFGAALSYRADIGRHGPALPIEAGISYRAAFSGTGGATPKASTFAMTLRLFYHLWGGAGRPPPPVPEEGAVP